MQQKKVLVVLGLVASVSSCKLKYTDIGSISNGCEMMDGQKMLEKVCSRDHSCVEYDLGACEELVYTPRVSKHAKKDWERDFKDAFKPPGPGHRVNANIDTYKKWGIGERRFFIISNEESNPNASSHTFYFHLNRFNMPRLLGVTFYDKQKGEVVEHTFEYTEPEDDAVLFASRDYARELKETRRYKK